MRRLIVWLAQETGREIVDKTGLTEAYDFSLVWTPDNLASNGDTSVGDTVDSALERYLGLKLVHRKEPVEMLVIDRLERVPTDN